jgi:hypothetical protein
MHIGNNSQPIQTNGQIDTQRGQQGQNITDLDNLVSALSAKSIKNKPPESPPPTLTAKKPQFEATQEEVDAFDSLTEPPKTLDDFDLSEGDSIEGAFNIREELGSASAASMFEDMENAELATDAHVEKRDSALNDLNEANQQPATLDDFDDFINEQGGGSRVQAGYDIRNASTPEEKSLAAEEMLLDKDSIKNKHDDAQILKDEMEIDHESQAISNARADDETLQKAGDDSDPIDLDNYVGRPITEEEGKQIDDFLSQFPDVPSENSPVKNEIETPPSAPTNPPIAPKANRPVSVSQQDVADLREMLKQNEAPPAPPTNAPIAPKANRGPISQDDVAELRKMHKNDALNGPQNRPSSERSYTRSEIDAQTAAYRARGKTIKERVNPLSDSNIETGVRSVGPLRRKASSVAGKVKSLFGRISFPSFTGVISSFKAKSKTPPAA